MDTIRKPATEFRITAVCTITDPAERQRRLSEVYRLIMDFGRQQRVAAKSEADTLTQAIG